MLLNRTTLELAKLASKEESRYTLQAIAVDDKQAVVTNGHIMVIAQHPSTQALEDSFPVTDGLTHQAIEPGKTVLISRDAALATLKALPKKTHIPILANAAMGTDGKLYVNQLDSVQSFKHAVSGQFPNWRQVIPTGEPIAEICLNPKLLKQLCDYFIAVGNERAVRLTLYDKTGAMRLDGRSRDSQDITALCMPFRSEDSQFAERPDQTRKLAAKRELEAAQKLAEEQAAKFEDAWFDAMDENEAFDKARFAAMQGTLPVVE